MQESLLTSSDPTRVASSTPSSNQESKTSASWPMLSAEALQRDEPLEGKSTTLFRGTYQGEAVTVQLLPASPLQQKSLQAFAQSALPFWLPVKGICQGTKSSSLVLAALPEMRFDQFLKSSASESWVNRCRLLRDVAVGLYQRRALGATHLGWDCQHLYLDAQDRAQLLPLVQETPMTEAEDVEKLGQLIWHIASGSSTVAKEWQKGAGLPPTCPPDLVAFLKTATDPVASARPSLKTLAKGLDACWQRAGSKGPEGVPSSEEKREKI